MKFFQLKPLNSTIFLALVTGGLLLLTTAVGCGDDDDGSTGGSGGSAAGSGGTTGGSGGTTGGSGGTTAGSGGTTGGSGGTAPVATEAEKQAACQCQRDNGTLPLDRLVDECVANISDECVACINDIAAGSSCAGMDSADFKSCAVGCTGMIAPPETEAECKEFVTASGQALGSEELTNCLCETCLADFGACSVDPICQEIMLCANESGCVSTACLNDPMCGDMITGYLSTAVNSVTTASMVGTCQESCLGVSPDGGTQDGGMADGG
jgi:hypothetical protein